MTNSSRLPAHCKTAARLLPMERSGQPCILPSLAGVFLLAATSAPASSNAELTPIPEIQGAGHVSPLVGQTVTTEGVVTAVGFSGYYLQDTKGDGNESTADAVVVFDRDASLNVSVGDQIRLRGVVTEFVPGGESGGNLSTTQIEPESIAVLATNQALPKPVRIGRRGRVPPSETVISSDETDPPIDLRNADDDAANTFDPESDGIDFHESLEGMRVKVVRPVAVSATRTFSPFSSEFVVLPNRGRFVTPFDARNRRGGIDLQPDPDNLGDQNPERMQIQIDGTLYPGNDVPAITVRDRLHDVIGVVGYSFGNFEVNATEIVEARSGFLPRERTRLRSNRRRATIASYNVLNLSADEPDAAQRTLLGAQIAQALGSPDIVALQEIQDDSAETDDGTTASDRTLAALVDDVVSAGGPSYEAVDIAPDNGTQGGVPGGNIRNAFLYDPSRVALEELFRLDADTLGAAGVADTAAFQGTRLPLVGRFLVRDRRVTVVNVHNTSRFGSTPIYGAVQPFVQAGESERERQAAALNAWLVSRLADDPDENIVILGDFNTFQFTNDLTTVLPGESEKLINLVDTLQDDKVYTFNFEGNSQVLDHAFVTSNLAGQARLDIVHLNVDFPRTADAIVASDHEPLVVQLRLPRDRH